MRIQVLQFPDSKTIQWYLKPFVHFIYKSKSIEIAFTVPFVLAGNWLWYFIPRWLQDRQMKDCINYYPDFCHKERGYAMGSKVKPFLGYVLVVEEGAVTHYKWWQYLKKYQYD